MLVKRYEFDNTKACLTFPLDCRDLTHKLEYVSPKTCNAMYNIVRIYIKHSFNREVNIYTMVVTWFCNDTVTTCD